MDRLTISDGPASLPAEKASFSAANRRQRAKHLGRQRPTGAKGGTAFRWRFRASILLAVLGASCAGGDSEGQPTVVSEVTPEVSAVSVTTLAPPTTIEPSPTAPRESTTDAPTTSLDSDAQVVSEFVQFFANDENTAARNLTVPGSAAFVYLDGIVALSNGDDGSAPFAGVTDNRDGSYTFRADGYSRTLSGFVVENGLISDLVRDGVPITRTVIASGATFEAGGVLGTVHSFRYFDGDLQVIVTTVNNSSDEAELSFGDYVTGGRQYTNIFSNSVRPGVTNTALATFEEVPPGEGILYGDIWIDSLSELDVELPVPSIGQ